MAELRLEVVEYTGPTRWDWVLSGPDGRLLARHEARLDPHDPQYDAFTDLTAQLRWAAIPGRRTQDEAELVDEVGGWIGDQVLGPVGAAMVAAGPATVRVVLPAGARWLAFCPLELAHVDGRPIAVQDVTLVMQTGDETADGPPPAPAAALARPRLRVLALFSLPGDGRPLNLRRERQALQRTFAGLGAGRAVDVRMLQYGVTRARLTETLSEAGGWDVIHIAGHGAPGELMLETSDGAADLVTGAELAGMLAAAPGRVSLVTVSACWSAALAPMGQLEFLRFAAPKGAPNEDEDAGPERRQAGLQALAIELVDRLDCAVLAMRYPVTDDFSIALAERLYPALVADGQPLPRALGGALRQLAGAFSPLSTATPALFGRHAIDLRLAAPPADQETGQATDQATDQSGDQDASKLAGFPPPPDHFVGRTLIMTRASAALAPDSGLSGALLLGLPGGGKTACALELAYTHEHAFDRLIWFSAAGEDPAAEEPPQPFLGTLAEILQRHRALVVIDGLESMLTADGQWRSEPWGRAINAMIEQQPGPGRLVLTSRFRPSNLSARMRAEPVGPLSADERLLLAAERTAERTGEQAGEQADDNAYRAAREAWTKAVGTSLDPAERDLFWFLCCAEPEDRLPPVLAATWENLQQRRGREGTAVNLPGGLAGGLKDLARLGLTTATEGAAGAHGLFKIDPAVAIAGRAQAGETFATAVATELADYWTAAAQSALDTEARDGQTAAVVRASLSAARYLLRLNRTSEAGQMIDQALARDSSRAMTTAVLPLISALVAAAPDRAERFAATALQALARARGTLDPDHAEAQLRDLLARAESAQDHRVAAMAGVKLIDHCLRTGRLAEALRLAEDHLRHVHQADLGPWSKLNAISLHLTVRLATGEASQVLDAVKQLRDPLQTLPDRSDDEREIAVGWNVRETMFECGRDAAMLEGEWDLTLELNDAVVASKVARGAPEDDVAAARFSAHGSLNHLGRANEARDLLLECREVFERARDVEMVGKVLSALAVTEMIRGHTDVSAELEADALRFKYRSGDVDAVDVSHHNLGNYLLAADGRQREAAAHQLASALIGAVTGSARAEQSAADLASLLRAQTTSGALTLPEDMAALDRATGRGVAALLGPHVPDPQALQDKLTEVIARATSSSAAPSATPAVEPRERAAFLAGWDPIIGGLVAADRGDAYAATVLRRTLAYYRNFPSWVPLVDVLLRITADNRERDRDLSADLSADLSGLSERNAMVAVRALDALAGRVRIPDELWPVMPYSAMFSDVIAGADGNAPAAAAARRGLAALGADPFKAGLATALERILDGERHPGLAASLDDPVARAVVEMVLRYLDSGYGESGRGARDAAG
jgi:tetratricopeptide (TPR) repeat protein